MYFALARSLTSSHSFSVSMDIYTYIYIYIYLCIYIDSHEYAYVCTHIYIYMDVHAHRYLYMYTYCTHACVLVNVYVTEICMYACTYSCVYSHACACMHSVGIAAAPSHKSANSHFVSHRPPWPEVVGVCKGRLGVLLSLPTSTRRYACPSHTVDQSMQPHGMCLCVCRFGALLIKTWTLEAWGGGLTQCSCWSKTGCWRLVGHIR